MTVPAVTAIVPEGIDDPRRPSGGNRYDRRVLDALRAIGWRVDETAVTGRWPSPDAAARRSLAGALEAADPGAAVLIDGLIASAAGDLVAAAAARSPVVALVHMPLASGWPELAGSERVMLQAVSGVLATSEWTRRLLASTYGVPAERMWVATPGSDPAPVARPSPTGARLLCVAAVTRPKGHDVLLAALEGLTGAGPIDSVGSCDSLDGATGDAWRCTCAGSLEVEPRFARNLGRQVRATGLAGRMRLVGPLDPRTLDGLYADTDLLVVPSRTETWGMVITEALARGIPVLASDVGGIPEALGRAPEGARPGMLVPPGDPVALERALRCWLSDGSLRDRLRAAALARRSRQPGWDRTAQRVAAALRAARRSEPAGTDPAPAPTVAEVPAVPTPGAGRWSPSRSR